MAELPIASSESQSTTQSPQSGAQSVSGGTSTSSVQPGTSTSLLNSGTGSLTLHPTPLSTVNLSGQKTAAVSTQSDTVTATKSHHVGGVGIALIGLLFVVAIVLTWLTSRSAKSSRY